MMENETSIKYFYMLPFSGKMKNNPYISILFFFIYLVGLLINSSIITVICLEAQLHQPMYLFICNLSIVDIFYTSVTVPKLLHILLSGNPIVFFSQCYTQLYFFVVVATAEHILLFVMAYDRYVAICIPLHYHRILNRRNCILITTGFLAATFLNSLMFVTSVLNMSSCHSNIIQQFYCDPKSLTKITCTISPMFFVVNCVEVFFFVLIPLLGTFMSYLKIISIVFKMKTQESRKKASSTCSSHVTVIVIYFGTGLTEYLIPPYSDLLDSVFNIVFSTITPMINPIIYSLQNSKIQSALLGLVRAMFFLQSKIRLIHP